MLAIQAPVKTIAPGDSLIINVQRCEVSVTIQYLLTGTPTLKVEGSVDGTEYTNVLPQAITELSGCIVLYHIPLAYVKVSYTGSGTVKIGYAGV